MKIRFFKNEQASVLITALMTITILTMLCATSLYIISQNGTSGMAVASWQQALSAAESGIYAAVAALNEAQTIGQSAWQTPNWYTINTALPTPSPAASATPIKLAGYSYEPSGGTQATAPPSATQYNYLPSSGTLNISFPNSEGITGVTAWVTIDQAGMSGFPQWYRVRSTGQAKTSGPPRVSNNRLDNDLRNTIALNSNRRGGSYVGATRTIEVILQPLTSGFTRAALLQSAITMSGSGIIDSFNSSNPSYSTNGLYDSTKHESNANVLTDNPPGANSNLNNTVIDGTLSYAMPSGAAAPTNTSGVSGGTTVTSSVPIPTVSSPSWTVGSYTSYTGGGSQPFTTVNATGTKTNPTLIQVNGDFSLSGSQTVTINPPASGTGYVIFLVTGNYNTSGSSTVTQNVTTNSSGAVTASVNATWYVGGNITTSGGSYTNGSGIASQVNFIGYGGSSAHPATATISGSGNMVATMNLPNYGVTISGSGSLVGALIANNLTISGQAGIHYDQALGSGPANLGNYAFASWFEDNSDPTRNYSKYANANNLLTPIVY